MGAIFGLLRAALSIFRLVKDSRNNPSWAHTLAVPSAIFTMLKWLLGGVDVSVRGVHVIVPQVAASDAAMILGVWLAFLGQREYFDKGKQDAPKQ